MTEEAPTLSPPLLHAKPRSGVALSKISSTFCPLLDVKVFALENYGYGLISRGQFRLTYWTDRVEMEDLRKLWKVAVVWKERLKEGRWQPSLPPDVYQQNPAASLKHPVKVGEKSPI